MSVVDKELLFEPFTPDRTGYLAFRAYVAALAAGYVTRSDGTLCFDDATIRWQLLTGQPDVTGEEVNAVRAQLEDLGLVVVYVSVPRAYAFVAKWWVYNTRPDRARRGRHPEIPAEVLDSVPSFAAMYRKVPAAGEKPSSQPRRSGKSPEMPGRAGKRPAPDPEPAPEPAPAPVRESQAPIPVPGPPFLRAVERVATGRRATDRAGPPMIARVRVPTVEDVIEHFLAAYVQRLSVPYRPEQAEWGKVADMVGRLPESGRRELLTAVDTYVEDHHDATLGGFCEWFAEDPLRASGRGGG